MKVLPMGIIPAGSGNGMAASLLSPDPLSSAFTIIKGFQRPADVAVCIQNESVFLSFFFSFFLLNFCCFYFFYSSLTSHIKMKSRLDGFFLQLPGG